MSIKMRAVHVGAFRVANGPVGRRPLPRVSRITRSAAGPISRAGLRGGCCLGLGIPSGEVDVVGDGAVATPNAPLAAGGDRGVVGSEQDRHVVLVAEAGQQAPDAGGVLGVQAAGGLAGTRQRGDLISAPAVATRC
jgi:hypothetical protein